MVKQSPLEEKNLFSSLIFFISWLAIILSQSYKWMFKNWGLFKYIIKRKILTPYIKVLTKEKAHPKSLIPQYEISKIPPSYNFCESQPMINWPHTNHLLLYQDTSMASISIKQFFFIKHKKKSPFICLSQLLSFQFFFFFHSLIASSTSSVLVVVAFIA